MNTWYHLENEKEYDKAMSRFEQIRFAKKGSNEYREAMLLATLINVYEKNITLLAK